MLKLSSKRRHSGYVVVVSTKYKHLNISRVEYCKCLATTLRVDKMLSRYVRTTIMLKEQNWLNRSLASAVSMSVLRSV